MLLQQTPARRSRTALLWALHPSSGEEAPNLQHHLHATARPRRSRIRRRTSLESLSTHLQDKRSSLHGSACHLMAHSRYERTLGICELHCINDETHWCSTSEAGPHVALRSRFGREVFPVRQPSLAHCAAVSTDAATAPGDMGRYQISRALMHLHR